MQFNLRAPAPKITYDSQYSAHTMTITTAFAPLTLIISLHLRRFVTSLPFKCKSFLNLSTTSFHIFLGLPLYLAPSTSKVAHFSHNHHFL